MLAQEGERYKRYFGKRRERGSGVRDRQGEGDVAIKRQKMDQMKRGMVLRPTREKFDIRAEGKIRKDNILTKTELKQPREANRMNGR